MVAQGRTISETLEIARDVARRLLDAQAERHPLVEILNLQPLGSKAKAYQVKQVRNVPELPGCAADGATYAEAVANVQTAIDEWIETARDLGRDIPEPRGRLAYA